ncbi:hypothetical protein K501DRAFT_209633 [Backusella circina FSU 941]|nr:hypothetical protein K501DRAFT_209633 [Backusella circina FSU 941]
MPGLSTDQLVREMRQLKYDVESKDIDLGNCMEHRKLHSLERQYEIRLPEDYRIYLTEIGNGMNKGPCREGILAFGKSPENYPLYYSLPILSEAFPFSNREEGLEPSSSRIGGYLTLGTTKGSNEHFWILICEGQCRGEIWIASWQGDFYPCTPRMRFSEWLFDWLSDGFKIDDTLSSCECYPQTDVLEPPSEFTSTFRRLWDRRGAFDSLSRFMSSSLDDSYELYTHSTYSDDDIPSVH